YALSARAWGQRPPLPPMYSTQVRYLKENALAPTYNPGRENADPPEVDPEKVEPENLTRIPRGEPGTPQDTMISVECLPSDCCQTLGLLQGSSYAQATQHRA